MKGARRKIGSIEEKKGGAKRMSLRHKLRIVCSILLIFFLIVSNTSFIPSVRATPSGLNFSLTVFEDTGTAGVRSDDTKRSFSGLYSATYSWNLQSSRTRLATRFTKVGEIDKVRVCWEQGTSPTGTVYIRIETDAAGPYPSGTLADTDAQIGVSASSLPTSPEWREYTFPGPVTLSESNWYWIVLKYEPSGSETIAVRGSYVIGADLPANINLGGYYTNQWYTDTSWAYVAFVIPQTGHSLPLYRRTTLATELPVEAGLNQIADLPNDVNKVYRIVMQIQPKGDDWKWAPDDSHNTDYYIRNAGSTGQADIDTSDSQTWRQFILQTSAGNAGKKDVFIATDSLSSEWDGKSSVTLSECGDVNAESDPDNVNEKGIYPWDGTTWWDGIEDAITPANYWMPIEFWFKLDNDWSNNDIAELRYVQDAEGGHTPLTGFVYKVKVVGPEVDTYDSDYSTFKDNFLIGQTVYAKAKYLNTGSQYDFKYYSGWSGSPLLEGSQLNVAESPSGEWRSSYLLQGNDPSGTWGVRVFDAGTSTQRCNCSFTVQASPDKTAFTDGGSVSIGTGETTLATLSPLFSAGNNFVIAIVQFESTASTDIAAGKLRLTRGGTTLRSNQYIMPISSSNPHQQKWFALMAFDSSAPANPTYDVRATATATGISGEAKILAISGLTGSSVQGSSTLIDGPFPAKTTMATLSTSLPAGDNVVLAIVESINDVDNTARRDIRNCKLNRQSGSTLAESEYYMFHDQMANVGRWQVHLIPYLDVGAPANPTYNVTCIASLANVIHGRATIVAFSRGSLSAAYSDGGSVIIGTSETIVNKLNTNFQPGREVAVIASEQLWNMDTGNYNSINADLNKLQQNNASSGQATNQYTITYPLYSAADNGKGFGLLNRFTSTPSSPQYEVKATKSGTYSVNGEAKILALVRESEVDTYASDYSTLKDTYSIGETVYAKATNLSTQAGWLSGWDKRVKLTIDQNDVDADLSDFPVLVYLSTTSGRGSDDVSFIFDELQSNANRKKIAVTKSDGTTQCYVEIERWVQASEKAWLWVKAPGVSGTVDTDLYLYYDKDHANNTAYVGDVDSAVAQNVWDGNFKGVWHLSEASGGSGAIKDSTSNNNDGTDTGPTLGATGKIDSAIEFDGINDYIKVSDSPGLRGMAQLTLECWVNLQTKEAWNRLLEKANDTATSTNQEYLFILDDSADQKMSVEIWTTSGSSWILSNNAFPTNQWVYVVGRYNGTTVNLYINGVVQTQSSSTSGNIRNYANPLAIGAGTFHILDSIDGTMDEVRISNTARSAAWIKATNESERDHLIDFGGEEIGPRYDFRYYSDWTGSPLEEGSQLNVAESPSGEWRSLYTLLPSDPSGTWGVRVYDAGTSTERCSCSFTVQSAAPEFPHGVMAAVVALFAIYLVKRKRLEMNRLRVKRRVG